MKKPIWLQVLLILAFALGPAVASAIWHPRRPAWSREALAEGEIRLAEARRLPGLLWVDARPRAEYQREHVPGALSLNEDEWNALLAAFAVQWQPGKNVVVYCDSLECNASHAVAERLRKELGVSEIHVLKGGWQEWKAARK